MSKNMEMISHTFSDFCLCNDCWETPSMLYNEICTKYDVNPTLDVACTTSNCKCLNGFYINKGLDGLENEWSQDVWCNPPHSENKKWVKKAFLEYQKYNVTILMILPSNTVSSHYWHECIEKKAEYYPLEGRIRFLKNGESSSHMSRNAYFIVIWRKRNDNLLNDEFVADYEQTETQKGT